MNITSKLAGMAVSLALALGGFGLSGLGETAPAFAAPAIASPTQPAAVAALPVAEKPAADCAKQAWPYVARECLSAAQGTPVRNVTRTITAASAR
jgi:hypothetical protein